MLVLDQARQSSPSLKACVRPRQRPGSATSKINRPPGESIEDVCADHLQRLQRVVGIKQIVEDLTEPAILHASKAQCCIPLGRTLAPTSVAQPSKVRPARRLPGEAITAHRSMQPVRIPNEALPRGLGFCGRIKIVNGPVKARTALAHNEEECAKGNSRYTVHRLNDERGRVGNLSATTFVDDSCAGWRLSGFGRLGTFQPGEEVAAVTDADQQG